MSDDRVAKILKCHFFFSFFFQAQVHRNVHKFREVQQCTLLSIKTGGCSEDCSYCPQSSRYNTGLKAQKLMNKDAILEAAIKVLLVVWEVNKFLSAVTFLLAQNDNLTYYFSSSL